MGPLTWLRARNGRLPEDLRQAVTAEGLLLLAEGLAGTVTLRDYRAPGKRSALSKARTSGAVAITSARVVVWTGMYEGIDLDRGDWHALEVTLDHPDRICFAYDPATFHPDRSGRVEIRMTTTESGRVAELLGSP